MNQSLATDSEPDESDAGCEIERDDANEGSYPDESVADAEYVATEQFDSQQADEIQVTPEESVPEQISETQFAAEVVVEEDLVNEDPSANTTDGEQSAVWGSTAEQDPEAQHQSESEPESADLAPSEIAQDGAASIDEDAWPTYESSPAEVNELPAEVNDLDQQVDDQPEFDPTQVVDDDQGQADSIWNTTPDSEAVVNDHVDSESGENTSQAEEPIANDAALADQPDTPWQTEPIEEVQWGHEPAADDVAVTNDWSATQKAEESTWGDQTQETQFNDESVVSDEVEVTTDNAWGSTESLAEAS